MRPEGKASHYKISMDEEREYKGKLRHSSGCFQGKARELSIAPIWMWGAAGVEVAC